MFSLLVVLLFLSDQYFTPEGKLFYSHVLSTSDIHCSFQEMVVY